MNKKKHDYALVDTIRFPTFSKGTISKSSYILILFALATLIHFVGQDLKKTHIEEMKTQQDAYDSLERLIPKRERNR